MSDSPGRWHGLAVRLANPGSELAEMSVGSIFGVVLIAYPQLFGVTVPKADDGLSQTLASRLTGLLVGIGGLVFVSIDRTCQVMLHTDNPFAQYCISGRWEEKPVHFRRCSCMVCSVSLYPLCMLRQLHESRVNTLR